MSNEVREETLKVLLVRPGEYPKKMEIPNTLEAMQGLVGGLIQMIRPFEDEVVLICNDEGKLMGLPLNRALSIEGKVYDVIAGDFFLAYAPYDSENLKSLTEAQMEKYGQKFRYPEDFLFGKQGVIVTRYRPLDKNDRWER